MGTRDDTARELVDELGRVATGMLDGHQPIAAEHVVQLAGRAVPHAQHVSLTLLPSHRPLVTVAASDEIPVRIDALQRELRDGPHLDDGGTQVEVSADLATDSRWPRFGPRCVRVTTVRSLLCLRLPVQGEHRAAITWYSSREGAFAEDDMPTASVIVPFAILVAKADLLQREHTNLARALDTNRRIATAVGIIMSTRGLTNDDAFALLREASMALNIKLATLADEVNLTGFLDYGRSRRPG